MILKASQRAGAKQLGQHLLRTDDNDYVEIHEIRGFASDDVIGAMREAYAVSRGTKCKQFLFSVSLSPPQEESVSVDVVEDAIARIEERCGLAGQPRIVVFHEKNGRRHAHCVWSRIRADTLKALNLSHFKLKLQEVSRELYIENDWKMPRGFIDVSERNLLNFTREEWQQAKRIGRNPQAIKRVFQDCWAMSDSLKAFRSALEYRGYHLAKGDRRAFVAVDYQGEVDAIARWVGVRTKQVLERFGEPDKLPSVDEAQAELARKVAAKLTVFRMEARSEFEKARTGLLETRRVMVAQQRDERLWLKDMQAVRWNDESRMRQSRLRRGLKGIWDWVTGRSATIRAQNEEEWQIAMSRDQTERQALIDRQLVERRQLQRQMKEMEKRLDRELAELQAGPSLSHDQKAEEALDQSRELLRQPRPHLRL
jgi:hypothetical protein